MPSLPRGNQWKADPEGLFSGNECPAAAVGGRNIYIYIYIYYIHILYIYIYILSVKYYYIKVLYLKENKLNHNML